MKYSKLILTLLIMNFSGIAQNSDSYFLLEKAGRQRILCEQMTKNYLMIASNKYVEFAKTELNESENEFNENLKFLIVNIENQLIKEKISEVSDKWIDFKNKLIHEKYVPEINMILELSGKLSEVCNELIKNVYRENDFKNARTLNIFNKQKFNIQKLIKYCLLNDFDQKNQTKLNKFIQEVIISYELNNEFLKNTSKYDKNTQNLINKNIMDWSLSKNTFDIHNKNYNLENAIKNADEIMNKTNEMSNKMFDMYVTNAIITGR